MCGSVHLLHVDFNLAKADCIHTTPYVNTDNIGYGLVLYGHSCSDCAAHAGMNVGHNSDPASCSKLIITHPADLLNSFIFYDLGKADRGIHFSLDFHHSCAPE